MDYQRITLEVKNAVGILTLNHPEVLNAISPLMIDELRDALGRLEEPDHGIRCLLITGAGRGFCSGANLGGMGVRKSGSTMDDSYNPLFLRLRDLPFPIVTAINGAAAGIGMSLALMGDLVVAARSAFFLQAFRRIGLIPDGGATYMLPRLIGHKRALELSLLGERLPAPKALEWGLINRVVDDDQLREEALRLAEELAKGPTVALSLMRKAYWESLDNTFAQQLRLESVLQKLAGVTEDNKEGVASFREKRPAVFKGK
ncbi:MAG: enoyl-CoA hydratase/isomerase [Proteobacteria bacterium]|nr:enoyl-CoA hydratase/isomerase [Pseudomonadota bacterium]MBU4468916.1 enoyl-CoA hydratase/isomerase [Pseudomonadota bacterium]MCG2750909.1 enoyl-CoA hydratase/isomerase [Desulfobacteraceae bacterium]